MRSSIRRNRFLSAVMVLIVLLLNSLPGLAQVVISSNTTWTPSSIPTAGVSWDSANQRFILNDSLTINNNRTLSILSGDGVTGGSFLLTLPNAGTFLVNSGAVIDLSGFSGNGNGGNFTVNLGGTTGTIDIRGTIRSNGFGSGNGGIINLNGSTFNFSNGAVIEALGGTSGTGGYGGSINLHDVNGGALDIPSGVTLQTTGLADATRNLISIESDDISIDGTLTADGIVNGAGGQIILVADSGRIKLEDGARVYARGSGSGNGGTLDLKANLTSNAFDIDDCKRTDCSHPQDKQEILAHNNAQIRLNGGSANNGVLRIGRSASGVMDINLSKTSTNSFQGMGRVEWGNDGGNTTDLTMSSYDVTSDFNGADPVMAFYATGGITATNKNNFGQVEAHSSGAGDINVTDNLNFMTVTGLSNTSGNTTLTVNNGGALTLQNATASGTVNLRTGGIITATSGNAITGPINITGTSGGNSTAGTVSLTNAAPTTITQLNTYSNATVVTTGASSDLTLSGANIAGAASLTSGRDIIANDTGNNFGTSTAASGRNVNLYDNAGTFALNGVTTTGTLDASAASGNSITLANTDVTGAASISTSGGGGISGITGNTFRNTASLTTGSITGGNIGVSADFRGNTSLLGNQVSATDTAGNLSVTSYRQGGTDGTLTASGVGGNVILTLDNASLNGAGGAGKLTVASAGSITVNGAGWSDTSDTLVGNSTSNGSITLNDFATSQITGRTGAQSGPSTGTWLGTGGVYNLNGLSVSGNVDIGTSGAKVGNITLGTAAKPISITGTTAFQSTGDVIGTGSYTGSISGSAARIGIEATSGNLTSAGLTATSGTGWWGASDESLIAVADNGSILGTGFTASGLGNIRLQAGSASGLGAGNYINVNNVSAAQNLMLIASGANAGSAITVGGTSNVAGAIVATGLDSNNYFSGANGSINLTLSSGNLKTALAWTAGKDINLTASNGSILQDGSVYSAWFPNMHGNTLATSSDWTQPANVGNINLTAGGGASRYIDSGGYGANITLRASGDSNSNGTGTSAQFFGKAFGNLSVANLSNGNVTGNVNLGTGIGAPDDLDDVNTVMDVVGTTTVKANGNVKTYGSFGGPITIIGKTLTGQVDAGNLNIGQITTSATTGTAINLAVLQGRMTGGNLTSTGSAGIFLQAGSQLPRDNLTYINLSNVTAGGNLTVVVGGSTTGDSGGQSVVITGSKGGTSSATKVGGGSPTGSVSMP